MISRFFLAAVLTVVVAVTGPTATGEEVETTMIYTHVLQQARKAKVAAAAKAKFGGAPGNGAQPQQVGDAREGRRP